MERVRVFDDPGIEIIFGSYPHDIITQKSIKLMHHIPETEKRKITKYLITKKVLKAEVRNRRGGLKCRRSGDTSMELKAMLVMGVKSQVIPKGSNDSTRREARSNRPLPDLLRTKYPSSDLPMVEEGPNAGEKARRARIEGAAAASDTEHV